MKNPSSPLLPPSTEDSKVPRTQHTLVQQITQAWLRFSGPDLSRFNDSLESQEQLRYSRILSVLQFLIIVAIGLFAPEALFTPSLWVPLATVGLFTLASLLCNRSRQITASTILYILGVDAAIVVLLTTLPNGLRNSNLPDFDLFLVATLAGGITLPRRLMPFLVIFHISLIVLLFTLVPHQQLLTQEIIQYGEGYYGEINDAIVLQVIGASIAWLNSWSVHRALLRASKAEDLATANQRLNEYMQLQIAQKANLEYGIQVLKEAHARFANGDYKARALLQDNELASLALSFNLLAERLNRIASIALEYTRLEQAFQQLFAVRDTLIRRGTLSPFNPTGTYVDQIYPWMTQFYQTRQLFAQYSKFVDKVRSILLRHRVLVTQLKSVLDQNQINTQALSKDPRIPHSAREDIEKSQLLCLQIEEQGKLCLQETQLFEQLCKAST